MGAVPAVQQEEQLGEGQGGAGHGCGGMAWTLVNLGHFAVPASPPPLPPFLPYTSSTPMDRVCLPQFMFVYLDCLLRAVRI